MKKTVLFTKKLTDDQRIQLQDCFSVYDEAFIKKTLFQSYKLDIQNAVEKAGFDNFIITSPFATHVVGEWCSENNKKLKRVFVAGQTSADVLKGVAEEVIISPTGNAKGIAEMIIKSYFNEQFTFFSGKQRLDTIPTLLKKANIRFSEVCLYDTIPVQPKTIPPFDIIVFFSPSAVRSYFSKFTIKNQEVIAVGITTEKAIAEFTDIQCKLPDSPSFDSIAKLLLL